MIIILILTTHFSFHIFWISARYCKWHVLYKSRPMLHSRNSRLYAMRRFFNFFSRVNPEDVWFFPEYICNKNESIEWSLWWSNNGWEWSQPRFRYFWKYAVQNRLTFFGTNPINQKSAIQNEPPCWVGLKGH